MNEVIEKENIESMIYEIRGIQVMLDRDLARLYHVETKSFIQAVKRNKKRFPSNFMFQLTYDEFLIWRSQFVTSKNDTIGLRRPPYAFTEQGIAMLSSILHSDTAINTSICIIDAFVKMRHLIFDNNDVYKSITNINNKLIEHDEKLDYLFSKFDKKEQLFLQNTEYDAYSSFVSIFKEAKKELIIVDSYADTTLLDIIRKLSCNVILITKDSDRLSNSEIEKYNRQYHNLKVTRSNTFHDRYFIIDKKEIYHSGTSINNAGDKLFSINKLEDKFVKEKIINEINKIVIKKEANELL